MRASQREVEIDRDQERAEKIELEDLTWDEALAEVRFDLVRRSSQ